MIIAAALTLGVFAAAATAVPKKASPFSDYRGERPGVSHLITVRDLPPPKPDEDVSNGPELVARPKDAWPKAPPGFSVGLYAEGLENPRLLRVAPNGDVFLAESYAGRIRVLRGLTPEGKPQISRVFALGLHQPFGIAFYPPGPDPQWVYVADTDAVLRFPYKSGELKPLGRPEQIAKLPAGGHLEGGGHWTRDLAFSKDGRRLFISVGSRTNVTDIDEDAAREFHRAGILACDPDGANLRVYASGLRNAVGIAVEPRTGELWASVNERDRLGDNLPPDFITHVEEGGFYGWPWYYIGGHQDPRFPGKHPELRDTVLVPDVLIQPHDASLELAFYEGEQFPKAYRGDIFAAEHGSWNRSARTGYEVIRVPMEKGRAKGGYEDFLTGFVTQDGKVWGRPVGVAVAGDGALLVSDDGSGSVWRVSSSGSRKRAKKSSRP